MGKIACVENIYDTLVEAGLSPDHACFDDLIFGCVSAAVDPAAAGKEIPEILAELDEERTEEEICLDLADYRHGCGCKEHLETIVAKAVEMGRWGFRNGHTLKAADAD